MSLILIQLYIEVHINILINFEPKRANSSNDATLYQYKILSWIDANWSQLEGYDQMIKLPCINGNNCRSYYYWIFGCRHSQLNEQYCQNSGFLPYLLASRISTFMQNEDARWGANCHIINVLVFNSGSRLVVFQPSWCTSCCLSSCFD